MMPYPRLAGSLARAAGYLCSAHDELVRAGYAEWVDELCGLLETINMELTWLEDDHDTR